jgi:hypothetical protein
MSVLEKYSGLIRRINLAGWEPLTEATVEGELANQVLLERWGGENADELYFTIRAKNNLVPAGNARLIFNANKLGVDENLIAFELVDNQTIATKIINGNACLTFTLPKDRTLLIHLCKKPVESVK